MRVDNGPVTGISKRKPAGAVRAVDTGLHLKRSSESVWTAGPDGRATGSRKHVASDQQSGTLPKTASLQVFDDLDSLRKHVPHELYALVEAAAEQPVIEDLDI